MVKADTRRWYAKQPWLVGTNYIPATAINQLEMWQADTFDPQRIDTELGWASSLGMNTVRVFLHDMLGCRMPRDSATVSMRSCELLTGTDEADACAVRFLLESLSAARRATVPEPGVHNSGWVQGPGADP